MSASWVCLKCKRPVPSGLSSLLVVPGAFGIDRNGGKRTFDVAHEMHDALCAECHAEIKAGPEDVPEPEVLSCEKCGEVIEQDRGVCVSCYQEAEARAPVLEGGAVVAV